MQQTEIYSPCAKDAVSEVGKSGYPGGLITRRAVSTFAKLRVAVSSNQPLATYYFLQTKEAGLFKAMPLDARQDIFP